jgi:hypothetical protein
MKLVDEYVQGWTAPIDYELKRTNETTRKLETFDASNSTPGLVLVDRDGVAVDVSGKVSWFDATNSVIRYTPASGDLLAAKSPYRARWTITDSGKLSTYPKGEMIEWQIRTP